jgi:hypothetical protein
MYKKMLVLALGMVLGAVQVGWAGTVELAWDPNAEADLAGYRLHYGTTSGSYTEMEVISNDRNTWTVTNLTAGTTYYFALKAFDTSGNESGFSNEVSAEVPDSVEPLGQPGQPIYVP